jgi:tripartite-type tricarboxylate transporter receptor subunit TctC
MAFFEIPLDRRYPMRSSCAAILFVLASAASAQYPDHTITMVVPFPPGGVADTVARPVADAMSRELKQPVVVENKGGAGGAIGMAQVAKAKPDGYTILMSLASLTVLPEADKILGRDPMYQISQLRPIARFTADPTVFAVRADAPWKTLAEFIEDAKKNPGKFTYGSSGNYGTMHVPMEMFAGAAGIKLVHVPYTGAGPAIIGLLGGQVDALATGPASIVQHVKSGKVRVLAHWGDARLVALPDVRSLKELGTNVEYAQWSGLFVPAATPDAAVAKLRDAARVAANDPKVKEVLLTAGSPVQYLDMPEFQRYVEADAAKMSETVKRIGKVE